MDILRQKVKADKKLLVDQNMQFTEAEAKGFWPVYEAYQKDLEGINKRTGSLIKSYSGDYNANTLTDEKAKKLIDEALAIEESQLKLRRTYSQKLAQVLPQKKVARYLQIENKIRSALNYELADGIPLVE
jgi:hypothetical protein